MTAEEKAKLRKLRDERRAAGLCYLCGKFYADKPHSRVLCRDCLAKRQQQAQRRAARRQAATALKGDFTTLES